MITKTTVNAQFYGSTYQKLDFHRGRLIERCGKS